MRRTAWKGLLGSVLDLEDEAEAAFNLNPDHPNPNPNPNPNPLLLERPFGRGRDGVHGVLLGAPALFVGGG